MAGLLSIINCKSNVPRTRVAFSITDAKMLFIMFKEVIENAFSPTTFSVKDLNLMLVHALYQKSAISKHNSVEAG